MTEKQFTTHIDECGMYYYIFDGKKILAEAFYKDDAKEIVDKLNTLYEENQALKGSLYAEKTNTVEVINDYAKQFKRHSQEFSFMIDLAEDLGVNVKKLEALDD